MLSFKTDGEGQIEETVTGVSEGGRATDRRSERETEREEDNRETDRRRGRGEVR